MRGFWISARRALTIVAAGPDDWSPRFAICKRAHAGLLKSRARLFVSERGQAENAFVPTAFWWAEGHEALEQDWERGDFSTCIDQSFQLRAFGVEFDFAGLREMLPAELGADAARALSIIGDSNWLAAAAAERFMHQELGFDPAQAGRALLDHCRLGFVPARALLMQRSLSGTHDHWASEEREWDVPDWFWENFTKTGASSQEWQRGIFQGRGKAPDGAVMMKLTGVHFHREALEALAPSKKGPAFEPQRNKGGRPRKEWWDDLWCEIWGRIVHGEFTPTKQADVEKAMLDWVSATGETVSESTIRPMARKLFAEWDREAKN